MDHGSTAHERFLRRYGEPLMAASFAAAADPKAKLRELYARELGSAERRFSPQQDSLDDIRRALGEAGPWRAENLDWRYARIADQLELEGFALREILANLERPLTAEELELKRLAEEAYAEGRSDDAIRDFERLREINPRDFSVHLYLGNLRFFDQGDAEQAVYAYSRAAKQARSAAPAMAARALLHLGLVRRLEHQLDEACVCSEEALHLAPSAAAAYEHAVNLALAGRREESLASLEGALRSQPLLAVRAAADPDLTIQGASVRELIAALTAEEDRRGNEALPTVVRSISIAEAASRPAGVPPWAELHFAKVRSDLERVRAVLPRLETTADTYLRRHARRRGLGLVAIMLLESLAQAVERLTTELEAQETAHVLHSDRIETEIRGKGSSRKAGLGCVGVATLALLVPAILGAAPILALLLPLPLAGWFLLRRAWRKDDALRRQPLALEAAHLQKTAFTIQVFANSVSQVLPGMAPLRALAGGSVSEAP
jgi:tetratricopeptide (TPR) repeat protein